MKQIVKIGIAVYLAVVMLFGMVGIPYFVHYCTMSMQSDVCFSAHIDDNHCKENINTPKSCTENDDCCTKNVSLLTIDIQSVPQVLIAADVFSPVLVATVITLPEVLLNKDLIIPHLSNAPPPDTGRSVRISIQSFLC